MNPCNMRLLKSLMFLMCALLRHTHALDLPLSHDERTVIDRIAITEDKRLSELYVETPEKERMVGDIYLGKVEAVLPGIQVWYTAEKAGYRFRPGAFYDLTGEFENRKAQAEGMTAESVIARLLDEIPEPKIPKYV